MGKFVKNDGTKIPIGTVLFDGATQSDFTLTDDISNYDYLEIFYRSHNWVSPKSTRMSLKAGDYILFRVVVKDEQQNDSYTGANTMLTVNTINDTFVGLEKGYSVVFLK